MGLIEKGDNRMSGGHKLRFIGCSRWLRRLSTELCAGGSSRGGGRVREEVCGLSAHGGWNCKVNVTKSKSIMDERF